MSSTMLEKAKYFKRHSHLQIFVKFCDFCEKHAKITKFYKHLKMVVPFARITFLWYYRAHFWMLQNHTLSGKKIQIKKYYFFMEKFDFQNLKLNRISWNSPSSTTFSRRASYEDSSVKVRLTGWKTLLFYATRGFPVVVQHPEW